MIIDTSRIIKIDKIEPNKIAKISKIGNKIAKIILCGNVNIFSC